MVFELNENSTVPTTNAAQLGDFWPRFRVHSNCGKCIEGVCMDIPSQEWPKRRISMVGPKLSAARSDPFGCHLKAHHTTDPPKNNPDDFLGLSVAGSGGSRQGRAKHSHQGAVCA